MLLPQWQQLILSQLDRQPSLHFLWKVAILLESLERGSKELRLKYRSRYSLAMRLR